MSVPVNQFQFGHQTITTRVAMMVPKHGAARSYIDVLDAMEDKAAARSISLTVMGEDRLDTNAGAPPTDDPFAEVEV
jgi:hypothetical protein